MNALRTVKHATVYVKADARVPYQKLLAVLEALQPRPTVLLTAAPKPAPKGEITPPYGVKVALGGQ